MLNRRTALKTLGAISASSAIPSLALAQKKEAPLTGPLRFGLIADLHGGLAQDAESRLDSFLSAMSEEACDGLIQLGDFAFPNDKHQVYADKFNAAHDQTIHVIGNHEFDYGLTRDDCYRAWGIDTSYYRRDVGGLRILVLDGNDQGSPTHGGGYPSYIGSKQQAWLAEELEKTDRPTLILSHQPLAGKSCINNAEDIQSLLAKHASKIVACLNGHSHVDSLVQIAGIPYLHINSASYYWVGGKERMAYYADPLFTTLTINSETATLELSAKSSRWKEKSPKQIGYFERENPPPESIVTPRIRPHHVSPTKLNVMTWNIWGRLNEDPRYTVDEKTARERTIEIIRNSNADVVAMIEAYGSAADIAASLGFHYHTAAADANLCIFSRYPLSDVELLEGLNPFSFIAATVTLPKGQKVRVYDIWLTSGGRHIVAIKDKSVSDEAFAVGDDNRHDHLKQLLEHPTFKKDIAASDSIPLIVAGDFNCVTHLDHTAATSKAGLNQLRKLPIKVSQAMQQAGFEDTYRAARPNMTAESLGHTWTTVGTDYVYESNKGFVKTDAHPRPEYQNPYARIDYVYALGKQLETVDADVITRHHDYPTRGFPEFPSDHAAVITQFRVFNEPR